MYQRTRSRSGAGWEKVGVTTVIFHEQPVEGLIIRHGGREWESRRVVVNTNTQTMEVHLTPATSGFL